MKLRRILTHFTLLICLVSLLVPSLPIQAADLHVDLSEETVTADVDASDWYMAGANPQRTSWVSEEVRGKMYVEWYRPIEAYIDQKVQVITAYDNLYLSTARGLYVLKAATGDLVWRYDTELPLGHSPTVIGGKVYVGGYDKKLHALNALTGAKIWEFAGAGAGYSVNPLVVEGKVYTGNRDGYFYAVNAATGELAWKYPAAGQPPLGPIKFSAAYDAGVIYFVSTDMHAYALNAASGALLWKSPKLLGESFQSWWPVIYRDKVVFSGSASYRYSADPGTQSIKNAENVGYIDFVNGIERDDIFPPEMKLTHGTLIGPVFKADLQNGPWDWAAGTQVMDASRTLAYFEDNGQQQFNSRTHKPWRRTYFVLNKNDGSEFTFDSDGDGHREYAPILHYGTKNGTAYPPIVMPDNVIYQNAPHVYRGIISGGQVMGWKLGTPYLSMAGAVSAIDEPQAISGGGNLLYRNLCCDRVASAFSDITDPNYRSRTYWGYNEPLTQLAPGYDSMWTIRPGHPRLDGNYIGKYGSVNGLYHNHGDQNPLVPYNGMIFSHRSNAIIALGPANGARKLPLLEIQETQDQVVLPSTQELQARLEREIQKMIDAGRLRPGYHNDGMAPFRQLHDYFNNPGDTLYTLTRAYPHLSTEMQAQLAGYLQAEYETYFGANMIGKIGWNAGAAREYMTLPPEVEAAMTGDNSAARASGWPWQYPQNNFYAMWKYAEIFPQQAGEAYQKAKSKLELPAGADNERLASFPWENNAFIAGYIGFLNLQTLAGQTQADQALRNQVQKELDRLLALRVSQFRKDAPWGTSGSIHRRRFSLAANFILLVPELGQYLRTHALAQLEEALAEYTYVGPFWFVTSFEGTYNEGVRQHLYDPISLFQAKAYILQESREELYKVLDAPAFRVGDLFYIQNLVAVMEAGEPGPRLSAPQINPNGGVFDADQVVVTLYTDTADAAVHYTLDGSYPTQTSPLYTAPLTLTTHTTVKARAFRSGYHPSPVTTALFRVGKDKNLPPTVKAGNHQDLILGATANLAASVNDDGLPDPPGEVKTIWSKVSGPGNVIFGNATAIQTTAQFSAVGFYVLRLTANDGELSASDDVTVTITEGTLPIGALIKDLVVSSGKTYQVDVLNVGKLPYIDRNFLFTQVPGSLANHIYIRTANDDKNNNSNNHLRFTLVQAATVYVAFDHRVNRLPAWIEGWSLGSERLITSDGELKLYAKQFPAGEVSLGGNAAPPMAGAQSNYLVLIAPAGNSVAHSIYLPAITR
ncbi:MAG: PQQ-binding-like beta-propeller repeat protein [Caldilineaceae bacterium]|nr:PQQ-binding-like beta-propeller repeat protein [Caldilineaceae bacterium]